MPASRIEHRTYEVIIQPPGDPDIAIVAEWPFFIYPDGRISTTWPHVRAVDGIEIRPFPPSLRVAIARWVNAHVDQEEICNRFRDEASIKKAPQ